MVMSPSRRLSTPGIGAAHPMNMHLSSLQHAQLAAGGMTPSQMSAFFKSPSTSPNSQTATAPTHHHAASSDPLNRLQKMQPFDFRKLSAAAGLTMDDHSRRRQPGRDELNLMQQMSMASGHLPFSLHGPPGGHMSLANSLNPLAAAAASGNQLAASLVAQSFPNLLQQQHQQQRSKSPLLHRAKSPEKLDGTEKGDALNLTASSSTRQSRYHQQLPSPHRKSASPVKRSWGHLPPNLGSQFINPVTGKKRVQCNVCLKTFCDKGALKIHFSAVHLREMHKCTVEGCSMMFSSRRSRNRHSANPNPKLHSPHLRRKISPHDGRSSQPHHMLFPPPGLPMPGGLNMHPFGPFPQFPADMRHPGFSAMDLKATMEFQHRLEKERMRKDDESSSKSPDLSDDEDGFLVVGDDEHSISGSEDYSNNRSTPDVQATPEPEQEMHDSMIQDEPQDFSMAKKLPSVSSDADEPNEKEEKEELPTNKRKRKSLNPTKCAIQRTDLLPEEKKSRNEEEGEALSLVKTETTETLDLSVKQEKDKNGNEKYPKYLIDVKPPEELLENPVPLIKKEKQDDDHLESSTRTLRRLEDLSKLNEMRGLLGPQFPPLNYLNAVPPSPEHSRTSSPSESDDHEMMEQCCANGKIEAIDEKDAKQCTACGKHFSNHFGVKSHYQDEHLKLNHKCNIDGCNAAFPSKRSRDRHSSNLNLHRKLLSTSSEPSSQQLSASNNNHQQHQMNNVDSKAAAFSAFSNPLHTEFLARLYADSQNFSLEALKNANYEHLLNGAAVASQRFPPANANPFLFPPLSSLTGFPGLSSFASHLLPPHLNGFNTAAAASLRGQLSRSDSPLSACSPPPSQNIPSPVASNHSNHSHCDDGGGRRSIERKTPSS